MKKSLLALAALSAFATAAQAQSSVTAYGVIDVNIGSSDSGAANGSSMSTAVGESALATSVFGFRGTEDLGGGLKAEFQLESRFDPTTGRLGTTGTNDVGSGNTTTTASQIFNREAWVGLSDAKLGAIRIGRSDVTSTQAIDSIVGQAGAFTDAAGATNLGWDVAKVVRYTTPTIGGFTLQVGYSNETASSTVSAETATADASTGETTAGRLTSVFGSYVAGKLGVYAGQTSKKIDASYDQEETAYGAKYDFGFVSVGAYQSKLDAATNTGNDFKQTMLSAAAPLPVLGAGVTAHAVWYKNEYKVANTSGDVDGYKLALTKALSKRTRGYVGYIDQATNNTTNKDSTTYVVGVAHSF
jgi:predicted porin